MRSEAEKPGIFPLLAILAGTALLYLPTLGFDFVYDDRPQILSNPRLTSWRYLGSYFTQHLWIHTSASGPYYRPMFLVWLRANFALFGRWAPGWHATTILLNLAAVALAYLILRRLGGTPSFFLLATAIFAFHPAHVESVAWISGVTDPLMAMALLGSIWCWLNAREHRLVWMAAALLLELVAILVKETAMVEPALVFAAAIALAPSERWKIKVRSAIADSWAFLVPAIAYWPVRWWVVGKQLDPAARSFSAALANVPSAVLFYARHLGWPHRLSVFYDFGLQPTTPARTSAAWLVITAMVLVGWIAFRLSGRVFFGWVWLVVPLAPALAGLRVFNPHDCVHDRYLYLPTLGLGVLVGLAVERIPNGSLQVFGHSAARVFVGGTVLAALAWTTVAELPPWRDNLTLYARGTQVAPNNPIPYQHMGFEMNRRNRLQDALALYRKAYDLDPNDFGANFAMGGMSYQLERWEDTIAYCAHANQLHPDWINACYVMEARALLKLNRAKEAETVVREAIARWPDELGQHAVLGDVLARQEQPDAARDEYRAELALDPRSSQARDGLARLEGNH